MTIEEVKDRCLELAEMYGYELDVPVVANKRMKSTLGRVKYTTYKGKCTALKIEFSSEFIESDDPNIEDTVKHEMAHFFVLKDTQKSHKHDEVWKKWAKKIGCKPKATTVIRDFNNKKESYKYHILCEACSSLIGKYKRKGKVIANYKRYKSKCCNSKIRIIKLNEQ